LSTIDSTTQFLVFVALGVAAIVVGAIVSLVIYLKQRSRKSLSYKKQTITQLLSIGSEIKGKLKITYDSKEAEDVYLAIVEIFNSGNVSIVETDYKEPIKLSFGKYAQVLTTEVAEVEPANLQISINSDGTEITLVPTLFNPRDSVTIKSLVNKLEGVYLSGRFIGLKEITESTSKLSSDSVSTGLITVISIISVIGVYFSNIFKNNAMLGIQFYTLVIPAIAVGLFLFLLETIDWLFNKVKKNHYKQSK
jgi:hypothetical protein